MSGMALDPGTWHWLGVRLDADYYTLLGRIDELMSWEYYEDE